MDCRKDKGIAVAAGCDEISPGLGFSWGAGFFRVDGGAEHCVRIMRDLLMEFASSECVALPVRGVKVRRAGRCGGILGGWVVSSGLRGPARVPAESVHRMPADRPDLAGAAVAYSQELTRVLGAPARMDFVLLGVGQDGHVASLFPGHAALSDAGLVVAVADAPRPPSGRLTLTLPVLAQAARVVVMAFGQSKAAVIQEAIEHERSSLPAARVLQQANRPLVLADKGAASLTGGGGQLPGS